MIKLSDYISKENFLFLQSENPKTIIKEMVDKTILIDNLDELENEKNKIIKEKSICHGIEISEGILLSHTRNDIVDDIVFHIGFCKTPVLFSKKIKIEIIIFILIPESKSRIYLSLIARLSRFLHDNQIQAIFFKQDVDAILQKVKEFDA